VVILLFLRKANGHCLTAFFVAFYLIHHTVKSKVKGLFKGFALVLYEERMAGNVDFDFGNFVFDGVANVVEDEVNFGIHNFVVKGAQFFHLLVDAFGEPAVGVKMNSPDLYVHAVLDLVKRKIKRPGIPIGFLFFGVEKVQKHLWFPTQCY